MDQLRQILFYASKDLHAEIKKRAAVRGISMKTYITRAVMEQIKKEKQYEQA